MVFELVCTDGVVLELKAGATWGWGTSSPPTPTLGNTKDIIVTGTGSKITVDTKNSVIEADLNTAVSGVVDSYHASAFGNFMNISPLSVGTDGEVGSISLSGITPATKLDHEGNGVILDNDTGTFTVTVTTPANCPCPPIPPASGTKVPDPTLSYAGTWSLKSNPNTKLDVDES